MGLCYQYNSNATWDEETKSYQFKKVFKGGAGNGLKMLLVTEEDEYLPPQIESFGERQFAREIPIDFEPLCY